MSYLGKNVKMGHSMMVKDKIVVITGGAGVIGSSIVKELLSNNAKYVAIFELDNENARAVFNELETLYQERVGFYPCDVTKTEMISENFDRVIESQRAIDILINNAGIAGENLAERMIDINFKAVVVASYMLIDRIGKHKGGTAGKGGVIVNIASILGIVNLRAPTYCATKHAVVSFTRTLKESYNVTGVRVVAICPGVTDTPILKMGAEHDIDFIKMIDPASDLENLYLQSPDNVATAVLSIIEKGESGDVWVATKDTPAYPVEETEDYRNYV